MGPPTPRATTPRLWLVLERTRKAGKEVEKIGEEGKDEEKGSEGERVGFCHYL